MVGLAVAVGGLSIAPASATAGPVAAFSSGGDDRRIVRYRVHRGDTATGIAVRFHAWTDELVALNHLGRGATVRVGQVLRVPVVVSAARRAARKHRHYAATHSGHKPRPHRAHKHKHHARPHKHKHHAKPHHKPAHAQHPKRHHGLRPHHLGNRWPRHTVRKLLVRTARRHGVDKHLGLAVAWQESGWQQNRRSSAGAIGVMQVMPATGRWLSSVMERRLYLHDIRDNATGGMYYLALLRESASRRDAVASYYQGPGSVRQHGYYGSTRQYVSSVFALKRRLERGHPLY